MEIAIILFLILLNGVFSMSEIALISARKNRLENAAKKGNPSAQAALDLSNNPERFGMFRLLETDNRVLLPIKTHVKLLISSADVLHSCR